MRWKKLGLVFEQRGYMPWAKSSALTPTPVLMADNSIRVYAGFRDDNGISRIGYADVSADNPTRILRTSDLPVLDRGQDGCFDDNGVILGDVVAVNNKLRMYYVGFQLVKRAKFLAFTGIAESPDGGESFARLSEAPILDRRDGAITIRAVHTALFDDGIWKIWYAAGNSWERINGVEYPRYDIWYTTSSDGLVLEEPGQLSLAPRGDEYRIGRPSVYRIGSGYAMLFTKGTRSGGYSAGMARSSDGINWQRCDEDLGLRPSQSGFDSKHLSYPRLLTAGDKTYCFYNGNDMGHAGFGAAELVAW